ncbi:GAF domain-containing protein [Candidatus Dependentiae bacterium]|nr:GAF domain-containing protein [Candidatus Dependentiae bacterium]
MTNLYNFPSHSYNLIKFYLAIESSRTLDELLNTIGKEISKFLDSDRTSLFLYDKEDNILYSKVAQGLDNEILKIQIGQGIAGYVAQTRKFLISNNVYECEYFDKNFDKFTNYKTEKILCMPLINMQQELVGVIQVLNKTDGNFDEFDIEKLNSLTTIVAVALDNSKLFDELSDLKSYNENIVNSVNLSIIVIDKHNKIKSYNQHFIKNFGTLTEVKINSDILTTLNFIDNIFELILDARENGFVKKNEIDSIINEKQYYFNIQLRKLTNDEDNILILLDDSTELVSLKKSEHLALIGKFSSSIIHDIKSPMSIISGYAQLINSIESSNDAKKYSSIIIDEINRLVNMSREILDFSKGEIKLNLSLIKIGDLFLMTESNIKYQFESEQMFFEYIQKDNPIVNIDVDRFKRVIYNITSNAKAAMTAGGKFSIKILFHDKNKNFIDIIFSDTGAGIPEKFRSRIFEPFVSYNKLTGTGLGMAIVKKVVEEHNGTIILESEINKGTNFIITLPVYKHISSKKEEK